MPVKKLTDYLDEQNVNYEIITHSESFTAQQTAASAHIPGKEIAKTVMVFVDNQLSMAVLPASYRIDMDLLKEVTGSKNVKLAGESDFKSIFPDCETGAMPPFGNLYDIPVFVAHSLTEDEEIAFNAGTHTELIKMSYSDYARLVKPVVLTFSYH
ncbi:MAG: YbaK/EbsC family protein [Fulvivirga sp.]|nr:YbaK/EbsC family protein [Fulvivirga sp.]